MPVTIRNITGRPVQMSLTSGATLRLAPGQTSDELPEVEVRNNAKVDKLQGQNTIEVTHTQRDTTPSAPPEAARATGEDASGDRPSSKRRAGSAG